MLQLLHTTAYVTTQTRLKLYEYLRELDESLLYCDTDSVIYIRNGNKLRRVKTGDYLGDLTDELKEYDAGSYIEEFVWGGPKSMRFLSFALPRENEQRNVK